MFTPSRCATWSFVLPPLANFGLGLLLPRLRQGSSLEGYLLRARILALIHNSGVASSSLYVALQKEYMAKPMAYIPALRGLLAMEAGWNAQDLLFGLLMSVRFSHAYLQQKNKRSVVLSIAIHHIAMVLLIGTFFFLGKGGDYYIAVLLLMTSSNVWMHASYLARVLLSQRAARPLLKAIGFLLPPAFLTSRFLIFPWIVHIFSIDKGVSFWEAVSLLRLECKFGWAGFTIFNSWLGYLIFLRKKII